MGITVYQRYAYDDVALLASTDVEANSWTLEVQAQDKPDWLPIDARVIDSHLNWSTPDLSVWESLRDGDAATIKLKFPEASPTIPAGQPFAVMWDISDWLFWNDGRTAEDRWFRFIDPAGSAHYFQHASFGDKRSFGGHADTTRTRFDGDRLWPINDWTDFKEWLVHSFGALNVGDVFELGPSGEFVYHDDSLGQVVPNVQIVGLRDGVRLLRMSTSPLKAPALSSLSVRGVEFWQRAGGWTEATGGYLVSGDCELLSASCVDWFRDRWNMGFNELGCELHNPEPPTEPGDAAGTMTPSSLRGV